MTESRLDIENWLRAGWLCGIICNENGSYINQILGGATTPARLSAENRKAYPYQFLALGIIQSRNTLLTYQTIKRIKPLMIDVSIGS